MRKKCAVLLISVIVAALLSSCGSMKESRLFMMDTVIDLKVYGEKASECVSEMEDVLSDIDRNLSAYREDGELYQINLGKKIKAGEHLRSAVSMALLYKEKTDGAFSPMLGRVIDLWGIGEKNYIPTEKEIEEALIPSLKADVAISGDEISINPTARLNLGAIAKGYASDAMKKILVKNRISRAIVSLGGNVYVHGRREDDRPWNVALRDPKRSANDWFATIALEDRFIISSGDYERYFERDGVRYHHIIDPRTGAPAKSDLCSVIVVSQSGAQGDAYSTALYVMGRARALEFWRENEDFELVLVGHDGVVTVTEGIWNAFTPSDDGRYSYEVAQR